MASRGCKRDADSFCYICGEFIKVREKKYDLSKNLKICEAYQTYFNLPVKNQDKKWAPHVSCNSCRYILEGKFFLNCMKPCIRSFVTFYCRLVPR